MNDLTTEELLNLLKASKFVELRDAIEHLTPADGAHWRALICKQKGELEKAIRLMGEAVSLDSDTLMYQFFLIKFLVDQGQDWKLVSKKCDIFSKQVENPYFSFYKSTVFFLWAFSCVKLGLKQKAREVIDTIEDREVCYWTEGRLWKIEDLVS